MDPTQPSPSLAPNPSPVPMLPPPAPICPPTRASSTTHAPAPPVPRPGRQATVSVSISRPRPTARSVNPPSALAVIPAVPNPPNLSRSLARSPQNRPPGPPSDPGPDPPPSAPVPPHSRSSDSILVSPGSAETCLSARPCAQDGDFRVEIVTWNVGSAVPPDDISSLFGPGASDGGTDMFIIGLQEVNCMISKRLKDALFVDPWSELCMDTLGRLGHVLVASQRMHGVLLLVFSKFRHLPFLRGIQTQSTRTGLGGCWGNKGGVSVRMMVYGHPVCFLNCHLPAHMRNLEQRLEDFESILQQQQFEGGAAVGVLDHDVVFWFGDLNFRIDDYDIHVVKSAIENRNLSLLWEKDQLNIAKNSESVFEGFIEGPLHFPPTYKFDVGTHTYDTSAKKRKPAWTDRILWRLRRTSSPVPSHSASLQRGLTSWLGGATGVSQRSYRSHMGFTVSDHKPVSALFSLHFPFRVDVPLVRLEVEKAWTRVSDAAASFTVTSGYQRSSGDWVGLYKVGFKHHKDYAAHVWAKSDHSAQVTFPEEDLPREGGEYVLGYYSHNMNSIVGITEAFQVHLPVNTPPAPPRPDTSGTSSEDDSTLVLLTPGSRSPSPGTRPARRRARHQRRSRSPAVPALQSLALRPRDPTPAGTRKERLFSPGSPLADGISAPEALVVAILGERRPPARSHMQAKAGGDSNR